MAKVFLHLTEYRSRVSAAIVVVESIIKAVHQIFERGICMRKILIYVNTVHIKKLSTIWGANMKTLCALVD